MVIEASAFLARRPNFTEAIAAASQRFVSAASLVELSIGISARYGSGGQAELVAAAASSARL